MTKLQPARGRVRINATGLIFPPDLCPEVSVVSDVQTTTQCIVSLADILQRITIVNCVCVKPLKE